ncbi:MAG: hypothetical protein GC150_04205 [Rhizobiales bacterium]|nr:hypothetical protein [Hyphomicrobiales bacterium]
METLIKTYAGLMDVAIYGARAGAAHEHEMVARSDERDQPSRHLRRDDRTSRFARIVRLPGKSS